MALAGRKQELFGLLDGVISLLLSTCAAVRLALLFLLLGLGWICYLGNKPV